MGKEGLSLQDQIGRGPKIGTRVTKEEGLERATFKRQEGSEGEIGR